MESGKRFSKSTCKRSLRVVFGMPHPPECSLIVLLLLQTGNVYTGITLTVAYILETLLVCGQSKQATDARDGVLLQHSTQ